MASCRARLFRTLLTLASKVPGVAKPKMDPAALDRPGPLGPEVMRLIEQRRRSIARMTGWNPLPKETRLEMIDADGVPAAWVQREGARQDHVVLYLHGGGYVVGSIRTHQTLAAYLSRAADARVLLIDYRLAPEHPFPAAVEDAVRAYRWLLGQGIAPERTAVAGDSAGGGLTVATLLALEEADQPLPRAAACLSPWLDLTMSGETIETLADRDPVVRRPDLHFMAKAYLRGADPKTPTASPLFGDLAGLPPILIQVGTDEVLLDDARRFAEKAREAGVSVELDVWQDMIHVWQAAAGFVPESWKAIRRIGAFLKKHWAS